MLFPVKTQESRATQEIRVNVTPAGTFTTVDEAIPPLRLSRTSKAPMASDGSPTATHPDGPEQLTEYKNFDPACADGAPGAPLRTGTTSPTLWLS
jgi:hypothetical protein